MSTNQQEQTVPPHVAQTKQWRKDLDATLQEIKASQSCDGIGGRASGERQQAILKIHEAIMWLGMDLKDMGTPNPYPQSYNPASAAIEPTADGLKM